MILLKKQKQKEYKSMYNQIISWENICQAYLDLYENLLGKGTLRSYQILDGLTLSELESNIDEILKQAQKELSALNPVEPAKYVDIPKKTGGYRGIYMIPIKERVKSMAIFRVIQPYFEERFSKYLYSFRKSQPSYYASRAVRRTYLRNYGKEMYVLRMDIHKYCEFMDHNYIRYVLEKSGIEKAVIDLINLYLHQPYLKEESWSSLPRGSMQGIVFDSLFGNIYLHDLDDIVGDNVYFYRRMGDDIILFDRNKKKLEKIKEYLEKETHKRKIFFSTEKLNFGHIKDTEFIFHGLLYKDGKVMIPPHKVKKIITVWKKKFKYQKTLSINRKITKLIKQLQLDIGPDSNLFLGFVRSYNLITDIEQIKKLSKKFFHVLTIYFTGGLTYKKMAQTKKILEKIKFNTFSKLFKNYTRGEYKKVRK